MVSGGITNVYSAEAIKHAELYYNEIRKMKTDVVKIAKILVFRKNKFY